MLAKQPLKPHLFQVSKTLIDLNLSMLFIAKPEATLTFLSSFRTYARFLHLSLWSILVHFDARCKVCVCVCVCVHV
jgi:hypothetical protein